MDASPELLELLASTGEGFPFGPAQGHVHNLARVELDRRALEAETEEDEEDGDATPVAVSAAAAAVRAAAAPPLIPRRVAARPGRIPLTNMSTWLRLAMAQVVGNGDYNGDMFLNDVEVSGVGSEFAIAEHHG
eukprot:3167797-Prymnesium_polylepis.1